MSRKSRQISSLLFGMVFFASAFAMPLRASVPPVDRTTGDYNESDCIDIEDFLFLLDNFRLPVDGVVFDNIDFLIHASAWTGMRRCNGATVGDREKGDFDGSSCTDILDFLFLLDQWLLPFQGTVVDIQDFLGLVDNWGAGSLCDPPNPTPTPGPVAPLIKVFVEGGSSVYLGNSASVQIAVRTIQPVQGGALRITYDPAVIEIVGSTVVISSPSSPYQIVPPPYSPGPGILDVTFMNANFSPQTYDGPLATFDIIVIAPVSVASLSIAPTAPRGGTDARISGFSPEIPGTLLQGQTITILQVTPTPTPFD